MASLRKAVHLYRDQGITGLSKRVLAKALHSLDPADPFSNMEWTDGLNRLIYSHAGWLDRGNIHCFNHAIANLPSDAPIVEVGSFCGLSTNVLGYLKRVHGKRNPIVNCDLWTLAPGPDDPIAGGLKYSDYSAFTKEIFIRNVQRFNGSDMPYAYECYSDDLFASWKAGEVRSDIQGRNFQFGGPISFCYLDGDHSHQSVLRDFENVDRYLEVGGCIMFDDSSEECGWESRLAMRDVLETGRYEVLAKNPHYFVRKLKA